LVGQAVHEVDVERRDAGLAQAFDGAQRNLDRLNAIDRRLDARIHVLHAEACTRDARLCEGIDCRVA
jgi:hypothetical protein